MKFYIFGLILIIIILSFSITKQKKITKDFSEGYSKLLQENSELRENLRIRTNELAKYKVLYNN